MTNRSVTRIILKVWGLIWIVTAVGSVGTLITLALSSSGGGDPFQQRYLSASFFANVGGAFIFGLALVLGAGKIATWLFRREESLSVVYSTEALQAAAFAVLGIYFVVQALPGMVAVLRTVTTKPRWDQQSSAEYLWEHQRDTFISSATQAVAGFLLFFGSATLSRFWHRLRPLSAPPADPERP